MKGWIHRHLLVLRKYVKKRYLLECVSQCCVEESDVDLSLPDFSLVWFGFPKSRNIRVLN